MHALLIMNTQFVQDPRIVSRPSRLSLMDRILLKVPQLTAALTLPLGLIYLLLMPPFQVPDELAHFNRATGISTGHCVAERLTSIPKSQSDMESAFPPEMEKQRGGARWVSKADLVRWMHRSQGDTQHTAVRNPAANLYTCIPYLPAAAGIGLARAFHLSPLAVLYAGRLANFLAFLLLLFAAMRAIPGLQAPLIALALMPMTLHQAASLSADALSISLAFFLLSYILKLSFDPRIVRIGRKQALLLAAAVLFSVLAKFNLWLLLLVLLIPAAKFTGRVTKLWLFGALLVLACFSAVLWQFGNRQRTEDYLAWQKQKGVDVQANAAFTREHPVKVVEDVVDSLAINGQRLIQMFAGYFGTLSTPLPKPLAWAYVAGVLLLGLTGSSNIKLSARTRLLIAFVFLASLLSVFALIFSFEIEESYIFHPPFVTRPIDAVQGRYFIPFALLLPLLFCNGRVRIPARLGLLFTILLVLVANGTGYYLIWQEYYRGAYMKTLQVYGVRWPDGQIFLSINGKLHHVPDERTLRNLNLHEPPSPGSPETQQSLVSGDFPPLPGRVIKKAHSMEIYFVDNGSRHLIPNSATQVALGLREVMTLPDLRVEAVPQGLPLTPVAAEKADGRTNGNR